MKHLIIILLFSVPAFMHAQSEIDWRKPASEVVRKKIQKQLEMEILSYKQLSCPEIKSEDYEENHGGVIMRKQPKYFFFPDTITSSYYQLIFDTIIPWGVDYYIVKKTGHRFTNFTEAVYINEDWRKGIDPLNTYFLTTPPFQDTISLDICSKYYPQDDWYMVWCDTIPDNRIALISGNVFLTPLSAPNGDLWRIVRKRMIQYEYKQGYFKMLPPTATHGRFLFERSNLNDHGFLLEIEKKYPHNMQMTYYTNKKEVTGGGLQDFYEVIIPRPVDEFKGYDPIKPILRKLTQEEVATLKQNEELFPEIWDVRFFEE